MTAHEGGHDYPPPTTTPLEPPETKHVSTMTLADQIDDVPWCVFTMPYPWYPLPGNIFEQIHVLTRRQARKRNRRLALERKLRNPVYARRRNRRQTIVLVALVIGIIGTLMKLPADPFGKSPAPPTSPALVQTTVTTVTPTGG
jgi:hypothetical protein